MRSQPYDFRMDIAVIAIVAALASAYSGDAIDAPPRS